MKMQNHVIANWRNHGYGVAKRITEQRATKKDSEKVKRVYENAYSNGWNDAIDYLVNSGLLIVSDK